MREERNRANARLPIWCLEKVPLAEEEIIKRSGSGKGLRSWRAINTQAETSHSKQTRAQWREGLSPLDAGGTLAFVAAQDSLLLFGRSTPFEH